MVVVPCIKCSLYALMKLEQMKKLVKFGEKLVAEPQSYILVPEALEKNEAEKCTEYLEGVVFVVVVDELDQGGEGKIRKFP